MVSCLIRGSSYVKVSLCKVLEGRRWHNRSSSDYWAQVLPGNTQYHLKLLPLNYYHPFLKPSLKYKEVQGYIWCRLERHHIPHSCQEGTISKVCSCSVICKRDVPLPNYVSKLKFPYLYPIGIYHMSNMHICSSCSVMWLSIPFQNQSQAYAFWPAPNMDNHVSLFYLTINFGYYIVKLDPLYRLLIFSFLILTIRNFVLWLMMPIKYYCFCSPLLIFINKEIIILNLAFQI